MIAVYCAAWHCCAATASPCSQKECADRWGARGSTAWFPRPPFAGTSPPSPPIMESALGFPPPPCSSPPGDCGVLGAGSGIPMIKPIQIALAPTRNRPLNMFLGVVLALASLLFLLALATWHATDPSLNTSVDSASVIVRNWVGPFGAYSSDLLLQSLGFTAFFLPLWTAVVA